MLFRRLFGPPDKAYVNAISKAGTIGLHMVSGIAVGALMGYGIDHWLETGPWGTGIFLVLGIIAGFKNVYLDTKSLVASQAAEEAEVDRAKADKAKANSVKEDEHAREHSKKS